jgi:hypothetical protein
MLLNSMVQKFEQNFSMLRKSLKISQASTPLRSAPNENRQANHSAGNTTILNLQKQ